MNMREITSHQINECNSAIRIHAHDAVAPGGAPAAYALTWPGQTASGPMEVSMSLQFQNGPIAEVGVNGVTHEVLLAILIDRLEGFQSGPYACEENADALRYLHAAADRLNARTRARVARGVEGTHEV